MVSTETERLLMAWRQAQRRLPARSPAERRAAIPDLARTWLAYELAVGTYPTDEIILVATDSRRYVAASPTAALYLGVDVDEIPGLRIEDLARPADQAGVRGQWDAFIRAGSVEGTYVLWRPDGQEIATTFRAKANTPIPGLHVTRMLPSATWVDRNTLIAETDRALVQALDSIVQSRRLLDTLRGPRPRLLRGRPPAASPAAVPRGDRGTEDVG